jgi:hypothetical protein
MPELAKFARQRLSQNQAPETHPDAGMLTGFMENALPPRLRSEVTAHLSYCAACRGVLRLALPQQQPEEVQQLVWGKPRHQVWSILRWASVAATTAVVAGSVWLAQAPKAIVGSSKSAAPAQIASATAPVRPQLAQPEISSGTPTTVSKPSVRRHTEPSVEVASSNPQDVIPSREIIQTGAPLNGATPITSFDSRAANVVPTPSTPKPEPTFKWTTNPATGLVYRSSDGMRWQSVSIRRGTAFTSVVPTDKAIWAAGNDGMLFHSVDNGKTWDQVRPWGNANAGDIQSVEFRDAQNGQVTTSIGTWTTIDGGINWKKQ